MSKRTTDIPPEFGQNIQARLNAKNWNQSDLARATKLGRDSISTYIRGMVMPDPKNIAKLADALDCSVGDLLPERASDDGRAVLEIKQLADGNVHVRINRPVSIEQAAAIFDILRQ